jgi:sterol desaturase/sphingolipid hydroxylase (fatty acid hydroxylase superfamily)
MRLVAIWTSAILIVLTLIHGEGVYSFLRDTYHAHAQPLLANRYLDLDSLVRGLYYALFLDKLLSPWWYILGALVLSLQQIFPARRGEYFFSASLAQDFGWLVLDSFFRVFVLSFWLRMLHWIYQEQLQFLTIDAAAELPLAGRLVLGVLAKDFLAWFHHLVRHKVAVFWAFHTVHHSQQHMNMFTNFRYHPVEYFISSTILWLPSLMLQLTYPQAAAWALFEIWYTNLYHASIRSNLGWLRYVLVTPQSHRLHHSVEPRHQDQNFGVIFSIWDYAFGTQSRDYDDYPDTGIADASYPHETLRSPPALIATACRQLAYPFRLLRRSRIGPLALASRFHGR